MICNVYTLLFKEKSYNTERATFSNTYITNNVCLHRNTARYLERIEIAVAFNISLMHTHIVGGDGEGLQPKNKNVKYGD